MKSTTEHLLILGRHGVDRLVGEAARRRGWAGDGMVAGDGLAGTLRDAALQAVGCLADVPGDIRPEQVRAAGEDVLCVPMPARSWYPAVFVDLGAGGAASRANITAGLAQTDPNQVALFLGRAPEGLPAHVHRISPEDVELTALVEWAQYLRAFLRTTPATRVLFADMVDAAVLGDALAKHDVAICSPVVPAGAASQRVLGDECMAWLQWLRTHEDGDWPLHIWELPSTRRHAARLLRQAVLLLPETPRDSWRGVLASAPKATMMPMTGDATAAFLSGGRGLAAPVMDGPPSVTCVRRTDRDPAWAPRRVLFACLHLLGDAISATPILRQYRRQHPQDHITFLVPDRPYARVFELSPDVDCLGYVQTPSGHDIVFASSRPLAEVVVATLGPFDATYVLDIQEVSRAVRVQQQRLHMAHGYASLAGIAIDNRRPALDPALASGFAPMQEPAQPFVVLSRHTVSGRHVPASAKNTKQWAEAKWHRLARRIRRELALHVVSIGAATESLLRQPGVVDVHGASILEIAGLLTRARALVSVDNGIFHLGLAMGTPVVHLYPDWLDANWTASCDEVPHRDLHGPLGKLGVDEVFRTLAELLGTHPGPGSSASRRHGARRAD